MIAKYRLSSGLICYAEFCDNVNSVFSDLVNPNDVIANAKSTSNFTDDDKDTLLALLGAIRTEIMNKRILIKPQFQDYDKTKSCHITTEQFRRVMKILSLIPPDEALFQLLIRKYLDSGNIREINYFKFCADIDRPQDIFPAYVPKNPVAEDWIFHGQLRDAGSTYFTEPT